MKRKTKSNQGTNETISEQELTGRDPAAVAAGGSGGDGGQVFGDGRRRDFEW